MSNLLRLTAQAEADAWQQSADAHAAHDYTRAENARTLVTAMAAEKMRLEAANDRYQLWSAGTATTRQAAGQAKTELARRGQEPATRDVPGPQTMRQWWHQFEADADAMDRAIQREHQAAIDAGQPWPPARQPQPERQSALQPEGSRPGQPEIVTPEPDRDDERAALLDELQARTAAAAARIAADHAEQDARAQHAARIDRQAHAEPERGTQATPQDPEIEL